MSTRRKFKNLKIVVNLINQVLNTWIPLYITLVLGIAEEHENPYLLFSGHLVFKDEKGKIVVK
jgi:hypothetical protein